MTIRQCAKVTHKPTGTVVWVGRGWNYRSWSSAVRDAKRFLACKLAFNQPKPTREIEWMECELEIDKVGLEEAERRFFARIRQRRNSSYS